jgi:hypothetical protein
LFAFDRHDYEPTSADAFLVAQNVNLVTIRTSCFVDGIGVAGVSNCIATIRNLGLEEGVLPVEVRPAAKEWCGPRGMVFDDTQATLPRM